MSGDEPARLSLRLRRAGLLAAAVLAFVVGLALYLARDRVTAENLARVRVGMTRGQVEAIFGRPEYREYERGEVHDEGTYSSISGPAAPGVDEVPIYQRLQWDGVRLHVVVIFDATERAVCRYSQPADPLNWGRWADRQSWRLRRLLNI